VADPAKLFDYDVLFERELGCILSMLKAATTTLAVVGTGRLDSGGRGRENLEQISAGVVALLRGELDPDFLARECVRYEDDPAV
jgi:hypothetical protein